MTERPPLLLLHGIDDRQKMFKWFRRELERDGWETHALDLLPANAAKGIEPLAAQVKSYVDSHLAGRRFDLVGFSMGGIVGRYYLQRLDGLERVHRFVSISSPHHGTVMAAVRRSKGARQMLPDSHFLADLNQDAYRLASIPFLSLWTPFDLVILPSPSSKMEQAKNECIPVLAHPLMLRNEAVLSRITRFLSQPTVTVNAVNAVNSTKLR